MWSGPLSLAQRLNLRLHWIALGLIALVTILNSFRPMLDQVDLGWHIAQGRWMVHHLAFYRADVLNYPTAGHPVVDEYPFFQLALYLSTLCGWWGPCLLCAIGYLLLLAILVLTGWALDLGASSIFALMLGGMLAYLNVAFPLRPHLVTFLGIAAFGSFLLRHREAATWTRFWPLALLQIVWTNSHGGFVLGPVMVALFGVEMVLRRWRRNRAFPTTAARIWTAATALVFLGCFANPYGVLRFGAPFYQEHLEAIRAYVGEMQPLNATANAGYQHLTLYAVLLIAIAVCLRRGACSWSFLLLAVVLYGESLQVKKAWPLFGIFLPLLVLSSAAFAHTTITRRKGLAFFSVAGHIVVLVPLVMVLMTRLGSSSDSSLSVLWHEWDAGRTELPVIATAWMKQNNVTGRLLHRCEDGGWLQQAGLLPTFADTGFGKYEEAFIRVTGLLADRPALLPIMLRNFNPRLVLCDDFAFAWPGYLTRAGCRLIFYSPNSSVWALPGVRPDLPTITHDKASNAFLTDIRQHGLPQDMLLYGRNLVALDSLGDEPFAVQQLLGLPLAMHRAGWFWEAARLMCFGPERNVPPDLVDKLRMEAASLGEITIDFRASDLVSRDTPEGFEQARSLLSKIRPADLSDHQALLLLKADRGLHLDDEALDLARRLNIFDLDDGDRWLALAELQSKAGDESGATAAWKKTLYYAPDLVPPSVPAARQSLPHAIRPSPLLPRNAGGAN